MIKNLKMKKEIIPIVLIGLFSILPYVPGCSKEFVFDDIVAVKNNKDMNDTLPWPIFYHDFWGTNLTSRNSHKSYRPITSLTFYLQGVTSAHQLKIVNLLLHCFTTYSLYWLVRILFTNPSLALITSLLFGCHPVHVEPVVSLVGRADILFSLLFIISSIILVRWHPVNIKTIVIKYFILLAVTGLSTLCKEQGILFLVFWFCFELWKTRLRTSKLFSKSFAGFSFFCGLSLVLLIYLRMHVINFEKPTFKQGDNPASFGSDFQTRFLSFNYIYFLNLFLLLFPSWLCFDWAMGCIPLISSASDPRIFLLLIMWTVFIILIFKSYHDIRRGVLETFFPMILLIVPFILSINMFIYVGFVIAERNLYLSAAGWILMVAKGYMKMRKRLGYFLKVLLTITIFCFFLRSHNRSHNWRSEYDLFINGLTVCNKNAKVHYNIAKKMVDQDRVDEAVIFYKESIRLQPEYEEALNNLGNLMKSRGKFADSEQLLLRATSVNPEFAAAFMNLGISQQAQNKFCSAEINYLTALKLRRHYPDCEYNLGNLYLKMKYLNKAEDKFRAALTITNNKHELAMANLILLLEETGRLVEATVLGKQAVTSFPDNPEFLFKLANILGKQDMFVESESLYLKALNISEKALYQSNLGVLYHRWGKFDEASNQYRRALQMNPKLEGARTNLRKLRKSRQ